MDDISVEINLGSVRSTGSELSFKLKLNNTGAGYLQIYASSSDGRRTGTIFFLDESEYNQLKAIIAKTEQKIQELRQSGGMRQMKKFLA
jgi:hypothetical protein